MPDNIGYTPGTGATVAADEIAGALYQRMKLILGADGENDGDVSAANPLPVTDDAVTDLLLRLLNIQRSPAGYDQSLNRSRVTGVLESGSTTAVTGTLTGVTTVTNMSNLGLYGATQLVDANTRTAWATLVRARIT